MSSTDAKKTRSKTLGKKAPAVKKIKKAAEALEAKAASKTAATAGAQVKPAKASAAGKATRPKAKRSTAKSSKATNQPRQPHVVFASSEVAPFSKTGGLGDVAGSLPQALLSAGCKVDVISPKYESISPELLEGLEKVMELYVDLSWRRAYVGLERIQRDGISYWFIDNEQYFKRPGLYGYFDDGERFAFFARAVAAAVAWVPELACDCVHCNDWQTALAPIYLNEFHHDNPSIQNTATVFTIHNMKFQGQFSDFVLGDVCGLAHVEAAARQLSYGEGAINFMKGALLYSDAVTTVSPSYAEEIKTAHYGEGLDAVCASRPNGVRGILNGIDQDSWNPATDTALPKNFSPEDLSGKAVCKLELQKELGLSQDLERPLIAMVGRLTAQKGLDLLVHEIDSIVSMGAQLAILGTGDSCYEEALSWYAQSYPQSVAVRIDFDLGLSRRIYAGADLFLMPSAFEPCGLSQMIAMRYGTLPLVRETGGLKDTVLPYNQFTGEGLGFSFSNFNAHEMSHVIYGALQLFYEDKASWKAMQLRAMKSDFSWKPAAQSYLELYHELCPWLDA